MLPPFHNESFIAAASVQRSICTTYAMERLTCRALLTPRLRQLVGEQIAAHNGRKRPPLNCRVQQLRYFAS